MLAVLLQVGSLPEGWTECRQEQQKPALQRGITCESGPCCCFTFALLLCVPGDSSFVKGDLHSVDYLCASAQLFLVWFSLARFSPNNSTPARQLDKGSIACPLIVAQLTV